MSLADLMNFCVSLEIDSPSRGRKRSLPCLLPKFPLPSSLEIDSPSRGRKLVRDTQLNEHIPFRN